MRFLPAGSDPSVFVPQDYFTAPEAYNTALSNQDLAGGLLLYTWNGNDRILAAVKDGASYVLDRNNLGHTWENSLQNFSLGYTTFDEYIVCNDSVYNHPNGGPLFKYPLNPDGTLLLTGVATQPATSGPKGCNLVCSYDTTSQSYILWETNCGPLVAYDAATLNILYNSQASPDPNDQTGQGTTYYVPTVVNGKVYVASKLPSQMMVYG